MLFDKLFLLFFLVSTVSLIQGLENNEKESAAIESSEDESTETESPKPKFLLSQDALPQVAFGRDARRRRKLKILPAEAADWEGKLQSYAQQFNTTSYEHADCQLVKVAFENFFKAKTWKLQKTYRLDSESRKGPVSISKRPLAKYLAIDLNTPKHFFKKGKKGKKHARRGGKRRGKNVPKWRREELHPGVLELLDHWRSELLNEQGKVSMKLDGIQAVRPTIKVLEDDILPAAAYCHLELTGGSINGGAKKSRPLFGRRHKKARRQLKRSERYFKDKYVLLKRLETVDSRVTKELRGVI